MRHGTLVAGGCLALLSLIRLDRGDVAAALLLAAVALLAVVWSVVSRVGGPGHDDGPAGGDPEVERARARSWRRIALLGLVLSVVGAFTFPPMALVVGALTLYAASRMRRSSRSLATHPVGSTG